MSDSVNQDDLAKALTALQDIAKGHSGRGTVTTEVESMRDAGKGAGSGAGSTQVHHTPSNSDPKGWAGSRASALPEDGATDSVGADGTDYVAQSAGLMKSIIEKMAKGIPLSADEAELYTSIAKGGLPPFMKKDEDKDDKDDKAEKAYSKDDDKDDKDMEKSLSDYASENDKVSKGLEVSEFLAGFANVMAKSLEAAESRIVARVLAAQTSEAQATGAFQKSLAEAVGRLGEAVTATAQRVDQVESQPAHAPRAVHNVQVLEKGSFGGPQGGQPLNKAIVAATLVDLVTKGEATTNDVLKFDSSGFLSPTAEAKVRAALGSR